MTDRDAPPTKAPSSPFERGLVHLLHEATVDHAAARRSRQSLDRERLGHNATFAALFSDLAGRRARVVVVGTDGRQVTGRVGYVGRDFAALAGTRHWLVRLSAIAAVIDEPGAAGSCGHHGTNGFVDRTWLEALHHLEGDRVVILGAQGLLASGVLRGCGHDLLRVESAPPRRSTYVNSQAVWAVAIEAELWGSAS